MKSVKMREEAMKFLNDITLIELLIVIAIVFILVGIFTVHLGNNEYECSERQLDLVERQTKICVASGGMNCFNIAKSDHCSIKKD